MNDICIVVCNFNGEKYLEECLKSLENQTYSDFDVVVVDNASDDDSVKVANEHDVLIIKNKENLGGAGGFHKGIQHALNCGYQYVMLLDNDVMVGPTVVEQLYNYMKTHHSYVMLGAEIYSMDEPAKKVWNSYKVDFENYNIKGGVVENTDEVIDCDYVAACAVMIKSSVLIECGDMPEDCFIYHDDLEMGWRIKQAGYRIGTLTGTKVLHKGGGGKSKAKNTFGLYYNKRNMYHFFAKYVESTDVEKYVDYVLESGFACLYGCNYKQWYGRLKGFWYAYEDFMNDVRGKAADGRIVALEDKKTDKRLEELLKSHGNKVYVHTGLSALSEGKMENCIRKIKNMLKNYGTNICINTGVERLEESGLQMILINHVKDIEKNILPDIYVDQYCNMILDEDDYGYYRNYERNFRLFRMMFADKIYETVMAVRCQR